MLLFKEFYKPKSPGLKATALGNKRVQKRHQKPMVGGSSRGYLRKHLNIMGDRYKKDNSIHPQFLKIKEYPGPIKMPIGKDVLSYVAHEYLKGRTPLPGEVKRLGGKLGGMFDIYVYHDGKNWVLHKKSP